MTRRPRSFEERLETGTGYAWLASRAEPKEPINLTGLWESFVPISDAEDVARSRIRSLAAQKGFTIGAFAAQDARVRHYKSGETYLAHAIRHIEGFVCGIHYRSLGPRFKGEKKSEPGSTFRYPAMPSLYYRGEGVPTRVRVCEGETDAAWLLDNWAGDTDAVVCHHAGAANYHRAWGIAIRRFEVVELATDWDDPATREDGRNWGEELAWRYAKDCPHATRVRPPAGKDWCSS